MQIAKGADKLAIFHNKIEFKEEYQKPDFWEINIGWLDNVY